MPHDHDHDDASHPRDGGLVLDLNTMMGRRQMLRLFAGAGLAGLGVTALAACGDSGGSTSTATPAATTAAADTAAASTASGATAAIPEETAGPYPGDGSNGVNVLTQSGVLREDIRSSFGSASGVADGVPLQIEFTVLDASTGAPMQGAAVYVWHCDRDGNYSLYSDAAANENYLRGVQETDADGKVAFTSIYPGCYAGRWPHIHFQVYPNVDEALAAGTETATSQIALPEDASSQVYATSGYEQSVANLSQVSLESDNVFSDGWEQELGTVTGSVTDGLTVALNVPVSA